MMTWKTKDLTEITNHTLSFFHEVYFISIMYIHVSSFSRCVKSQIHLSLSHSQKNGTGWYTICWLFPFLGLNSSFPTSSHFLFPSHFHEACYFQDDMQHDNDEGERHRILKQRKGTKFCYTKETSKRILLIILKNGDHAFFSFSNFIEHFLSYLCLTLYCLNIGKLLYQKTLLEHGYECTTVHVKYLNTN